MYRIVAQFSLTLFVAVHAGACVDRFVDDSPLAADGGDDASYVEMDPEAMSRPPRRRDAGTPAGDPDAATLTDAGYPLDASDELADGGGKDWHPPTGPTDTPSPSPARVYGITSSARLVRIAADSGSLERAVAISGIGDGEQIVGADIRPANGKLYALTDRARLYEVALDSGMAGPATQLVADANDASAPFSALGGKRFGVDWNPVADRLRVVSDAGENLRIDAATGGTTTDAAINPAASGLSAAAYTQSFGTACRTRLLVIDSAARRLSLQDPPNAGALTPIGGLGDEAFDEVSSFEIQTGADGTDRGWIAVTKDGATRLLDVDLQRGTASGPRHLGLDDGETLIALTALPPSAAPAQAPGELLGLTAGQRLISFNRGAPGKLCTSAEIAGLAKGDRLLGFDVRPADGALYAVGNSGALYTVAVPSGVATLVARLAADPADTTDPFSALRGSLFGVGWNPVADRLRVVSDNGQNLRIVAPSGATTTDVALSGATGGVAALAYTNAFAGTKSTTLFALDPSQMALVRIGGDPATTGACTPMLDAGNPNCGVASLIGMLGVTAGTAVNGFEIDGKTGTALIALTIGPATVSTLYTVDLVRGVATLPVGVANATIGGGEVLLGLTLAKVPAARAFALLGGATLSTFSLTTPSQPSSTVSITGLQSGECLLGIDVRPADGKLYAPGSSGRLYTIDPQTGAASLVSELAAASGDDMPFAGFVANPHGVDFNPAADLLRVVDIAGQNLRVVPSTRGDLRVGDVLTDTSLNPGTPAVTAAAYSDNYAASPATTLYVIDVALDSLFLQGGTQGTPSPNGGTLTGVGTLGLDAVGDVGFDIVGGHNGLAVAAIATADAGPSSLYSVDLKVGWVTPFNTAANTVGGDGTVAVTGFAIELK